jgi:hypothetical protein
MIRWITASVIQHVMDLLAGYNVCLSGTDILDYSDLIEINIDGPSRLKTGRSTYTWQLSLNVMLHIEASDDMFKTETFVEKAL